MSVCLSVAVSKLQTADRLGTCLKPFVSTESPSSHEFSSKYGLAIFLHIENTKNYREYRVARASVYLN